MESVVDLHVHSHYSRATSRDCTLAGLYRWGKLKGINIIGTGDFTHPKWFAECSDQLELDANGLYRLNAALADEVDASLPESVRSQPLWFVPTVEISTIYSKNGQVRKLHNLVIMPTLALAGQLNERLERIGNLHSDGRPILGLDAKELLRHSLEVSPESLYVPAHVWTPWFALFGSKSGFDTLEECYEELTPEIRAVETGLSSDPFMNWRLSQLDGLAVISNSDAHSPGKLGREATVLNIEPSYRELVSAIKTNDKRLVGTIEFFPEEGKYHYDGHRICNVRFTPAETKAHGGICPVCGKPLTVGVDYRVSELADRREDYRPKSAKRVEYIIPLPEILGELLGTGPASKKVINRYDELIRKLGNEFELLRALPIERIAETDPLLAVAIARLREGNVVREAGYDGIFGTIRVFKDPAERTAAASQLSLL
jgi:uncharacterized protein (TIGR00375 family)